MPKIALSGDWHFGRSNGSLDHNHDLIDFVDFMIDTCRQHGVDQFIHLGDWFDSRSKIDIRSMNYAITAVDKLTEQFGRYVQIVGNHDMYAKDSRDINSLEMFKDRVNVVRDIQVDGNLMYVPWLTTGEEYDRLIRLTKENQTQAIFGHFEFSTFKMNDHYVMEHGQSHRELAHVPRVFTGHYHGPQQKDNVLYLGGPLPMDMNDANSTQGVGDVRGRGFWIYDTDANTVERVFYYDVQVISLGVDEFLAHEGDFDSRTTLRVVIDRELSDEESTLTHDRMEALTCRNTKLVHKFDSSKILVEQSADELTLHALNIDHAVLEALEGMSMDAGNIDRDTLIALYRALLDDAE